MHESWVVSFPEGVCASPDGGEGLAIHGRFARVVLRRVPRLVLDALMRLAHPGESVGRLLACLQDSREPETLASFFYHLQSLAGRGFLRIAASEDGRPLATLVPMTPAFVLRRRGIADGPCVLSRFACIRREGGEMVLESPLTAARLILHDHRAAHLACALTAPATAAEIGHLAPELSAEVSAQLLDLMFAAGMLTTVSPDGVSAEDGNSTLLSWEFHDLLFHARSREGRHDGPVGNTYRFLGRLQSPPAVKPPTGGERIELERPDLERMENDDPPLARVMEQRCSIRNYAAEPIGAGQLGEFLYRVARVRARWEEQIVTPTGDLLSMEITSRPYPTGGSLFALEVYAAVRACRGLDSGLYHYDPVAHQLERLSGVTAEVAILLERAGQAAAIPGDTLQVLLIFGARFQRVAWKYASLAYSLILKDAGVLMQNMYLAATAMGLAPCALGVGDSDLFARAIGSDYCQETSVGEFLLGSRE